jgi:hypothetical protein
MGKNDNNVFQSQKIEFGEIRIPQIATSQPFL